MTAGHTTPETDLACQLVTDACGLVELLTDAGWADDDQLVEVLQLRAELVGVAGCVEDGAVLDDVRAAIATLNELLESLDALPAEDRRLAS